MAKNKKKVLLTAPEYAAYKGRNEGAVRYAIREGKLSKSLIKDGSGGILIDRDLADQEWQPRANWKRVESFEEVVEHVKKKQSKKPAVKSTQKKSKKKRKEWDPDNPWDISMLVPINVSRMRKEAHEAELARIKVEKELGKLVEAVEVEKQWVRISSITKTKVLGIPSKARQRMPDLTDSQYGVLEMIVREALEEISSDNITTSEDNE